MNKVERFSEPVVKPLFDANIRPRYEIEKAAWVWHPEKGFHDKASLIFENSFSVDSETDIIIHVSGDQRYELCLDGETISLGPDRCEVDHWSFASYKISLPGGEHYFKAVVWWIGKSAPVAQLSFRGGFIFAAEGALGEKLNTGTGNWTVRDNSAISYEDREVEKDAGPRLVGAHSTVGGKKLFNVEETFKPAVVKRPVKFNMWSGVRPGWKMHPTILPDQVMETKTPGIFIAFMPEGLGVENPFKEEHFEDGEVENWQGLLKGEKKEIPANTKLSVLWDLEEYFCGYSQVTLSGGEDSEFTMIWAESMFKNPVTNYSKHKGSRRELIGKYYHGLRDTFMTDGEADRSYQGYWWRTGRYILLNIETRDQPLTIDSISFRETRYPLNDEESFSCDDESINKLIPVAVRTIQMNAHETFMDCPHYEQTMYVGDTRLHMLINYAVSRDARLCRRGVEIFDWSRTYNFMINSGYPVGQQVIPTFPLYYALMVHDYAYWVDDPEFIKSTLVGLRGSTDQFLHLKREDGLLDPMPGWPFIDTVPEWDKTIYGSDPLAGPSSIINLLYVYALLKTAEIEEMIGEVELAARNRRQAKEISDKVLELFWDDERKMVKDMTVAQPWTEHAQVLALLTDILPEADREACYNSLISSDDLSRCQAVYWMFYLFEVHHKFGRGDLIIDQLPFWKGFVEDGFLTYPEMYEPSRSDCHGWGAHILFHFHTSLAGVRPVAPGFSKIMIKPAPGELKKIHSKLPHPRGFVETDLEFDGENCSAKIVLPDGVSGNFEWNGKEYPLNSGYQEIKAKFIKT